MFCHMDRYEYIEIEIKRKHCTGILSNLGKVWKGWNMCQGNKTLKLWSGMTTSCFFRLCRDGCLEFDWQLSHQPKQITHTKSKYTRVFGVTEPIRWAHEGNFIPFTFLLNMSSFQHLLGQCCVCSNIETSCGFLYEIYNTIVIAMM